MIILQRLSKWFRTSGANPIVAIGQSPKHSEHIYKTARIQAVCPTCGVATEVNVCEVLDSDESPDAYEALLSNLLNMAQCPAGHTWTAVAPILVHLPQQERLLFYATDNLSESHQNNVADALMAHFYASVGSSQEYMTDLTIIEGKAVNGYGTLIATLLRLEGRAERAAQICSKDNSYEAVERDEKCVDQASGVLDSQNEAVANSEELRTQLLLASKEHDPRTGLRLLTEIFEKAQRARDGLTASLAASGVGVCALKMVMNVLESGSPEAATLLTRARIALTYAVNTLTPDRYPEQWTGAHLNLALHASLVEPDEWKAFAAATEHYMAVLVTVPQRAAPEEWSRANAKLATKYRKWLETAELTADMTKFMRKIATDVLFYLNSTEERSEEIYWLRMLCLLLVSPSAASLDHDESHVASIFERLFYLLTEPDDLVWWAGVNQNLAANLASKQNQDRVPDFRAAIVALNRCLRVYTPDAYPIKYEENCLNLAEVSLGLGKLLIDDNRQASEAELKEADAALTIACDIFREFRREEKLLDTILQLSHLQRRLFGDPAELNERELHLLLMALAELNKDKYPDDWAYLHVNLGTCYAKRLHNEVGLFEFSDWTATGDGFHWLQMGGGLMKSYHLSLAEEHYCLALTHFTQKTHSVDWARTSAYLATVQLERTRMDIQKLDESSDKWIDAVSNYEEALELLERSAEVLKGTQANKDLQIVRGFLATAYSERPGSGQPVGLAQSIDSFRLLFQDDPTAASALNMLNFAEILLVAVTKGDMTKLGELDLICTRVQEVLDPTDYDKHMRLSRIRGDRHRSANDAGAAVVHYRHALAAASQQLTTGWTHESRNFYHHKTAELYRSAISCCLLLGDSANNTVFELAEQEASALLMHLMKTLPLPAPQLVCTELTEREHALLSDIRLTQDRAEKTLSTFERTSLVARIRDRQEQLDDCWREMAAWSGTDAYLRFRKGEPLTFAEMQRWLDEQSQPVGVVRFLILGDTLVAAFARSGKGIALVRQWHIENLPLQLRKFHVDHDQHNGPPDTNWLPEFEQVAAAIEDELVGLTLLYIVLDGKLENLPIHMVPLNGRPLWFHLPVAYAHSLWSAVRKQSLPEARSAAPDVRQVMVVGNPSEDEELEYSTEEARMVARMFGVTPLLGRAASKAVMLDGLRRCHLIHISGHGNFIDIAAPQSGLPLYGGDKLRATDVATITSPCSLLVLASCDTARHRAASSGGVIGLVNTCIASGVQHVLAAQWPVDDGATFELMREFYAELLKDSTQQEWDPPAALRNAAMYFDEQGVSRDCWAGFVIYGAV